MNKKPRVLCTGATGFIGCNMIAYLKSKGYWVKGVDIVVGDRVKQRGEQFKKANRIDCLDLREKGQALAATLDVDWVFHFASDMGGVGYFTKYNYEPYINNMRMDMNILEACKENGVKRLFYSSSACVYPTHLQMTKGAGIKLKESMIYPANADLNYGWEKLMMLQLCKEAPFDARVGILNTVYGEYQEIKGERMKFPTAIVTKAIQSKKDGKSIEIWGDGEQIRQFIHIKDFCESAYRVMTKKYNGPINITGTKGLTVTQYAQIVCKVLGIKPNFRYNDAKPSGVITRLLSNDKFMKEYGYENKVSYEEGFTRLIDHVYENS